MANGQDSQQALAKQERWQGHIDAQRRSGLSIGRYCHKHSLAQSTFEYWRRKLAVLPSVSPPVHASPVIVPVPIQALQHAETMTVPGPSAAPLRLVVAERFRIEIDGDFSTPVLEKLVVALERLA